MSIDLLVDSISRIKKSCPQLAHTFRFVTGAIWALASANKLGHRNRASYGAKDQQLHLDELDEVVHTLRKGATPPQKWEAAFYYNAAILRIDACYERLLTAVLKAIPSTFPKSTKQNLSKTEQMARQIESDLNTGSLAKCHLESVRNEVNKLKHELFGQEVHHAAQRTNPDDLDNALAALTELLGILENPTILSRLNSQYASPPPP
jgi:hypothetical protein